MHKKPELDMLFFLLIGWEVALISKGMYAVNQLMGFPSVDVDVLELVHPLPFRDIMVQV